MHWVGNVVDIVDLFSVQNFGLSEQIEPMDLHLSETDLQF